LKRFKDYLFETNSIKKKDEKEARRKSMRESLSNIISTNTTLNLYDIILTKDYPLIEGQVPQVNFICIRLKAD
jgi:hypothetical protein